MGPLQLELAVRPPEDIASVEEHLGARGVFGFRSAMDCTRLNDVTGDHGGCRGGTMESAVRIEHS